MAIRATGTAERNIAKLKRYQALETLAARLLGGWLPGIAKWEAKQQVARHIWEDLEFSKALRTRLWELRVTQPERGLAPHIKAAAKALSLAQRDYELLAGIYLVLKRQLLQAYERYIRDTYDIYDLPSVLALQGILPRRRSQLDWAERIVPELASDGEKQRGLRRWLRYAEEVIQALGGIDGVMPAAELPLAPPAYSSLLPFSDARRDARFTIETAPMDIPDENDQPARTIWQFANYVQEMQAAETLGSILWEVDGMDWEFYHDIARHCWDEARHSQLGQKRLGELGFHIVDFPSAVGAYASRQLFDPLRRYCALTCVIEADSFKLKHASYQRYLEIGDLASAQPIMYDIIDETMHVRFGQKWLPALMKRYAYTGSLSDLVKECRGIAAARSLVPAQRQTLPVH